MSKSRSERITERAVARGQLRRDETGRYRCKRHGKLFYPTPETAYEALVEHTRNRAMDPGAEVYPCDRGAGFHIGHRGRWRSLQRRMEIAGGTP